MKFSAAAILALTASVKASGRDNTEAQAERNLDGYPTYETYGYADPASAQGHGKGKKGYYYPPQTYDYSNYGVYDGYPATPVTYKPTPKPTPMPTTAAPSAAPTKECNVFINEFVVTNGPEFVEVAVENRGRVTDYNDWSIVPYIKACNNTGDDGGCPNGGGANDAQCDPANNAAVTEPSTQGCVENEPIPFTDRVAVQTVNGGSFFLFLFGGSFESGSGSDDGGAAGFALVDGDGDVKQFISYGSLGLGNCEFTAVDGPAAELTSTCIAGDQSNNFGRRRLDEEAVTSKLVSSILSTQLIGTGTTLEDFDYETLEQVSSGEVNPGQTLDGQDGMPVHNFGPN